MEFKERRIYKEFEKINGFVVRDLETMVNILTKDLVDFQNLQLEHPVRFSLLYLPKSNGFALLYNDARVTDKIKETCKDVTCFLSYLEFFSSYKMVTATAYRFIRKYNINVKQHSFYYVEDGYLIRQDAVVLHNWEVYENQNINCFIEANYEFRLDLPSDKIPLHELDRLYKKIAVKGKILEAIEKN